MEGETLVADFACFLHIVEKLTGADGLHVFPLLFVHGMHEIEVDMVRLQLFQFLVQDPLQVGTVLHQVRRNLGGDSHFFPVAVLQGFAQDDLRGFVQIDIGSIDVGDAAVDSPADQGNGLLLVNSAVPGCGTVKTHASQTESGSLDAEFAHGAVFHDDSSCKRTNE